jgi:hypothetical protein
VPFRGRIHLENVCSASLERIITAMAVSNEE